MRGLKDKIFVYKLRFSDFTDTIWNHRAGPELVGLNSTKYECSFKSWSEKESTIYSARFIIKLKKMLQNLVFFSGNCVSECPRQILRGKKKVQINQSPDATSGVLFNFNMLQPEIPWDPTNLSNSDKLLNSFSNPKT